MKTETLHQCLKELYKWQSLDKFLEPNSDPHLLKDEEQQNQELVLLNFVFPNKEIETVRVMPEDGDLRNYYSIYKHMINNKLILVNRNHGISIYKDDIKIV